MRFSYKIDEDLELRLAEERDAEEGYQLVMQNYEHLRRWLPWLDETYALEHAREFIRRNLQGFAENKGFGARIVFQGRMAGQIGFNMLDWKNSRTEIGYWLAEAFQGKGIMTKACRAFVGHAFDVLNLNRVEICCVTGNERSRRVPERLGFKLDGVLREGEWLHDSFHDLAVYSMLASEWRDKDSLSKGA